LTAIGDSDGGLGREPPQGVVAGGHLYLYIAAAHDDGHDQPERTDRQDLVEPEARAMLLDFDHTATHRSVVADARS
jgi:hypothetical protein